MRKIFALLVALVFLTSMVSTATAYSFGYYNPVYPKRELVVPSFVDVKIPTYKPTPILTDDKVNELAKNIKTDDNDPHDMDFYKWNEQHINDNDLCKPVPSIDVRKLCPWAWLHGFRYPVFQ